MSCSGDIDLSDHLLRPGKLVQFQIWGVRLRCSSAGIRSPLSTSAKEPENFQCSLVASSALNVMEQALLRISGK